MQKWVVTLLERESFGRQGTATQVWTLKQQELEKTATEHCPHSPGTVQQEVVLVRMVAKMPAVAAADPVDTEHTVGSVEAGLEEAATC